MEVLIVIQESLVQRLFESLFESLLERLFEVWFILEQIRYIIEPINCLLLKLHGERLYLFM